MSRRAPIIAGVVFVAIALVAVVLVVLPKMGDVRQARDDLAAAKDQEFSLNNQLEALQDAQAAAPETERRIAKIEDQVPPTADLPALIPILQGVADTSAVDFFLFSPASPVADASGSFSVIPSQITVTGSYFSLMEFLFLMEDLPRAAKVISLTVSPESTTTGAEGETPTTVSPSSLQMVLSVEFYTTDTSAGPGSVPGPTEPVAPGGATGATGPAGSTGSNPSEPGAA